MTLTNEKEVLMSLISDVEQKMYLYPNVELLYAYKDLTEQRYTYIRSSHVYPDVVSKFDDVIEKLEARLVSILNNA